MINDEARAIFEQAVELFESNPDDQKTRRDVVGLLLVAIDKADGSYPEAEAEAAWKYLLLRDVSKARLHADLALKSDPTQLLAQLVKVGIAFVALPGFFANRKYRLEVRRLLHIFDTLCQTDLESKDFVRYVNLLIGFSETMGVSSAREVYETIAAAPIDKLVYESDGDKADVERICLIAQGRLRI